MLTSKGYQDQAKLIMFPKNRKQNVQTNPKRYKTMQKYHCTLPNYKQSNYKVNNQPIYIINMNLTSVPKSKKPLPTRGIEGSYQIWLEQKRQQDSKLWQYNINYWYIKGKAYDLRDFINKHPGGSHWIEYTKGQNITEHYVVHHLNLEKVDQVLAKYQVKDPKRVQNSKLQDRYTFDKDGLYETVKKRMLEKYTIEELQDSSKTKLIGLVLFTFWLLTLIMTGYFTSYTLALLCGYLMFPVTGIAHNFVHMKNSLFKYLYLVTGFTPKEWEIMHCLSHHEYTNTLLDYELQAFEPIVYFVKAMPQNTILKLLIAEVVYFVTIPFNIVLKLVIVPLVKGNRPQWHYLVPLIEIVVFYILNGDLIESVKLFLFMQCFFGQIFTKITFGGHRIRTLWTEGEKQVKDFGEHSVYTCNDIYPELKGGFLSFFVMSGFNVHTVHHMFPTIDNQHLWKAHEILLEVCKERNIKTSNTTMFEAIKSVYVNYLFRKPWNMNEDKLE